jgi:hypothetical protein
VALQLVRSRHLYYMNSNGYWTYDGASDFSRIQRQDAFFRAVLAKVNQSVTSPLTINAFIGSAVGHLTIDDTLTESDMVHLALDFKGLPAKHLVTETLPTVGYTTGGGAAVLKLAEPYAQNVIDVFNAIGKPKPKPAAGRTTSTTSSPSVKPAAVDVQVLNASAVTGIAHTVANALVAQGFHVSEIGNAASPLGAGQPSVIRYGSSGYPAALTLGSALGGPVTYTSDPSLSGNTVSLLIAGPDLSVHAPTPGGSTTTTPSSTTTTTIPSDVVTNTNKEPWNPYPCGRGTTTQAAPKTTTTVKTARK